LVIGYSALDIGYSLIPRKYFLYIHTINFFILRFNGQSLQDVAQMTDKNKGKETEK